MSTLIVTGRLRFSAAHRLHNPALSAEESRRLFSRDNNPHGHGHSYTLEVFVTGGIDERTGYVIDLWALSRIVEEQIIDQLDHRQMKADVGFPPRTQACIRECHRRVLARARAARPTRRLTRLRLCRSRRVSFNTPIC